MIGEERIKQEAKKYRKYRELCGVIDPVALDEIEDAHYDGYMCAEKTVIEKACGWLKENGRDYATYDDSKIMPSMRADVNIKRLIKDFRKAMEE